MKDTIKYHRIVFRRSNIVNRVWKDIPGVPDLTIDFGWFDKLNESLRKFQEFYPDHRMVRHFAITEKEVNNGLTHKLYKPNRSTKQV